MPYGKNVNIDNNIFHTYYAKVKKGSRKILIVDDDAVSRSLLSHLLEGRYEILTAENGQEALDILKRESAEICMVLLDLLMPVMDGYEFLRIVREDLQLSMIPVIVTTAKDQEEEEIRCLELGAVDFLPKPYRMELVRCRVDRMIHLRETAAILNMVERDPLTGLYTKDFFYLKVAQILQDYKDCPYDMIVADMERFKIVNERLGVEAGDRVLQYMGERFKKLMGPGEICTRLHDDLFAMFVHHSDAQRRSELLWQWDEVVPGVTIHNPVIKYGIYENVNSNMPPFGMCDRAVFAMNRIKRHYGVNVAIYDHSLNKDILKEHQILDSMEDALKEHQFLVYYQPKYDIHNDCIAGAEALVRWIHPELGFMSPADFIPLFEHNGFISQLDFYVWEEVCRDLKAWKAEGRTIVPVSVNVSRIDFSDPLLVEKIVELTDRYGIDRELLHLEVTESVYMDELWQIIQMLKDLREKGFKIEMDDFGSGHSSLNVLSELPVDVLKLDMKFLREGSSSKKSILGFVISLSKWLNLKTVAEGVETKQQLVELKRFGCDYVQGYYYAKPMNRQEFEIYMEEHARAEEDKRDYLTAEFQEPAAIGKRKETILIAEDSEMNREILKSMLEPYYHIVEATNGKEAYAYLKKHADEISVILLDMIMPVMDGFQFLKKRSKHKEMDEIPVIITSELEEDSDLMALKLGADRFIGKPYQQSLLLLSIQNMIKWKKVSKSDKKK